MSVELELRRHNWAPTQQHHVRVLGFCAQEIMKMHHEYVVDCFWTVVFRAFFLYSHLQFFIVVSLLMVQTSVLEMINLCFVQVLRSSFCLHIVSRFCESVGSCFQSVSEQLVELLSF